MNSLPTSDTSFLWLIDSLEAADLKHLPVYRSIARSTPACFRRQDHTLELCLTAKPLHIDMISGVKNSDITFTPKD